MLGFLYIQLRWDRCNQTSLQMIAFILLLFLRSKQQWKLWWDFFSPKLRRKKYVNWYCREGLFCLTLFCIQIQVSSERRRRRKLLVNFFVARPSNLLLRTSDWFFSFFFVKSITFANCSNAIYITCFASVRNNDCRNFFLRGFGFLECVVKFPERNWIYFVWLWLSSF